ncbi:ferric reductase-like transmembrane domain-containing protein [Paenibacillus aestuarii]|uniref:Ferric reductase-like transmembrane domain-containing protein n=1 Tax=Paenibacillus aestuarii TaxID=516965 RepID=A0ABW0KGW2_9BACL|nr:ferric reductase-like transmembrane domain-containing protein [Paenibacillus aestuarii]
MVHFLISLPSWTLIRWFGLAAYISLFIGMALGILYSFPQLKGTAKLRTMQIHTLANHLGTGLALLHALLLVIDAYMPFDWHELLIPFTAGHSPGLNAIGTIAMYGLLLLVFTTDIRHKLKRKLWLAFHFLAYPIFALALVHGLLLGSDSAQQMIKMMYAATAAVLILLTALRAGIRPAQKSSGKMAKMKQG